MDYSQYNLEKTGYLKEDFRLFHINDQTKKDFSYHYHDFHKIIVFISGKVTYHIEGKAYHLKPRDILLVSQGAIHKPEIDPSVPYERYIFWIRDDLSCQELNTCFQKANDRSFNLVRADSALQERLKDLLPEIEQTFWRYSTEKCAVYSIHDIYQPDFSSHEQFPGQKNIFL
jgi:hypothetical protein